AVVAVADVDSPSIALAGTGLFDGTAASGVRPVVVQNASDVSCIKTLVVFADEDPTPIGVLDFDQDLNWCNWALPAPCKNASDLEIPVDTRLLADGDHSFVVKAYDAADNEKVSTTHYATIKNAAPADPTPTPTPPADPTPPTDPKPTPAGPG